MLRPQPKPKKHKRKSIAPTAEESRHMDKVAARGCAICEGPAEIHHCRERGEKRNHMKVIGLCPRHHRTGGRGVAIHAGKEAWLENFGHDSEYLQG